MACDLYRYVVRFRDSLPNITVLEIRKCSPALRPEKVMGNGTCPKALQCLENEIVITIKRYLKNYDGFHAGGFPSLRKIARRLTARTIHKRLHLWYNDVL